MVNERRARSTHEGRDDAVALEGLVVRTESGHHRVLARDRVVVCRAPKRLLYGERIATTAVVIGDRVRFRELKEGTGTILEILPRASELIRGSAGRRHYLDVIAANLDLLVAVHSLTEPEFVPARLDRFVLIAEAAEIPALVVLTKVDLVSEADLRTAAAPYEAAGYPVVATSTRTGDGIDRFRDLIAGKISALVGPSGVGKSTILNATQPGLRLRTGEISESTGKGKHTTTTAELLQLDSGGWVADTPGLRELSIRDVEPEDLGWLFPEFRPLAAQCRFVDCTHRQELGCAVRVAAEGCRVSASRYRTYCKIYEELVEQKPF